MNTPLIYLLFWFPGNSLGPGHQSPVQLDVRGRLPPAPDRRLPGLHLRRLLRPRRAARDDNGGQRTAAPLGLLLDVRGLRGAVGVWLKLQIKNESKGEKANNERAL